MAQSLVTSTLQDTSQAATAATRHLCAGAFLDREFRDLLLGQVRHNAARRVSPSYGFDLVPVASQAWRSWWLETTGQAFILALLVIAIAVDFSALMTAICASGIWYLGSLMLRHAPETARLHVKSTSARWLRRSLRVGERERHRELSRLLGVSGCAVLIVIGEVSAASGGSPAHGVFAAAVLMLLLGAAAAVIGAAHQTALNRTCSAGSLRPARLGRRLAMIDAGLSLAHHEDLTPAGHPLGWLVIRGISDDASARKDDDYHHIAARNAALVLRELLPYLPTTTPGRPVG